MRVSTVFCIMTSQEKTEEHPFVDIFNEDETEQCFLLSRPLHFVVLGKPGVGKTTLASKLAHAWKCICVEGLSVLEERIATGTESGNMLQSILISGHSIPDEVVTKLMIEKLSSSEVSHFGYIITEIPSLSQDAMTTLQQIEFIRNVNLNPDIIINIKCPDYDLCQRVSGQRQHSTTGYIYSRDQWDPEVIESRRKKKKDAQKERNIEVEGEEEEEQEEEAYIAEMQMIAESLQHLVQRPEDYLENVQNIIKLYKETALPALEKVMAEHDPQYLIELDGNKSPEELFMMVMERLRYLNLKRAAVLTKLQTAEEEVNDIMETEELFRTLASCKLIAARYKWQRSRWGRICPVALKEGNIISGLPDFSVSFLGKIYCLSSEEALKTFLLNPRPYLLPPMPAPPCKVFIFGPQYSGKTTLSNLIAEYYKGKVVDYATLVQPRFDEAREALIRNTIARATEAAINVVEEKLLTELRAKRQAEKTLRELQNQFGEKAFEEFPEYVSKGLGELHSSVDEGAHSQESHRDSALEDTLESRTKSEDALDDQTANADKDASIEDSIEEVTSDHPEVISMLEETLKMTKDMNFEQPYEKHAEILEEVLREVVEENKKRFAGAPKFGGWIVENCPVIKELWMVLTEKGIVPDLVICLSDTENNGKCLFNRIYLQNKSEIDSKILERLLNELQDKKEEAAARKAKEEALRIEEEKQRLLDTMHEGAKEAEEADNEAEEEIDGEESEFRGESEAPEVSENRESLLHEESEMSQTHKTEHESAIEPSEETAMEAEILKGSKEGLETEELFETVVLPKFPEDAYPDTPEMEPFKEKIASFKSTWKQLEPLISESFIPILKLEVANKTPKELLQKVVETMEKPFQYRAFELTVEDYDEEAEDYPAEAEDEVIEEEEEEEENEEGAKEKRRHLGDTKHFCPVVLKENFILQPGNTEEAAKYREKIYYFSSTEAKEKFLEHPEDYVAHKEPLKAPPLRICLLGPRGSGKTVCGRQLAEYFGIFHIQFEEFLQEKLLLKTGKKFGPEFVEESEEEQAVKQELEELATQANIKLEEENTKKQPSEVQLTEEEETTKSSLIDNEPLPSEILEVILSEWWHKEPICSTGFILDGFPRFPEEAQFLGEHGFFPDAAVFIQVDDQDVLDRLLPFQIEKWKLKQQKKSERKKLIKALKAKIKEDMIAKRRAELILERERKKKEMPVLQGVDQTEPLEFEGDRPLTVLGQVAKKLASEYGLKHLSVGEALRTVLSHHPETQLALMLNWHLYKGMTVPDELSVQALDLSLMDSACNTAGVVIDGYPVTTHQMDLLEKRSIIPMIVFELDIPSEEIFRRLILEKKYESSLPYPLHNSAQIIAIKNAVCHKNIGAIKQYYQEQHQNWYVIDGFHSKWWVWNEVIKTIQMVNKHMQKYLERIKEGKAACIDKLCITPQELISRLGEFGQFCPVSLAESYELFDCSEITSLEFAAEFRGHYYKMNSQEKLNKFLENPELYVPPLAPHPLPSADMIPKKLTLSELKSRFPKCAELQGYCPVTYEEGAHRYEALVPGNSNFAVEYRDHLYICENKEKLQKFLR
nr:LOW QUALITY PROTEIN: adenylate kinase 9-like [Cavia porcellus]